MTIMAGDAAPQPAPGEDLYPALALVNTRLQRHGEIWDSIASPAQAAQWLYRQGLTESALPADTHLSDALHRLREAIRALLEASIGNSAPLPEAIDALNGALRAAPTIAELRWPHPDPPQCDRLQLSDSVGEKALARLADNAVALLTGPHAAALAVCVAPDCIRLLLRTHRKRHWCSTRCGNRVRAARHYARTRPTVE